MRRTAAVLLLVLIPALILGGCATAKKNKDMEIQGLRNQISVLQAQVQSKDEEINSLKESSANMGQESGKEVCKGIPEAKSRPNAKQIQTALKNAGYDPGTIDGRMGKQSHDAIKAFQSANGLTADGKVGKKTWKLLSKYLYQKVK